jgi:hypothetical protein
MAQISSGHESGILDTSLLLLGRNDRTNKSDSGHDEQILVNVSNGNLVVQHRDGFMPSQGDDFLLLRTYNSRGYSGDAQQHDDSRWTFSTFTRLSVRQGNQGTYYEVEYGDGSVFDYYFNQATGLYESTDGADAYETIQNLRVNKPGKTAFVLTRHRWSSTSKVGCCAASIPTVSPPSTSTNQTA